MELASHKNELGAVKQKVELLVHELQLARQKIAQQEVANRKLSEDLKQATSYVAKLQP